ncbi:MAG: hypothetical protein VX764_07425 [Planctomycetota bacterium]|nr:hypothetical protein [Planctomycetota bacterium]
MKGKGFADALQRERGSMKPMVIFLYSSTMAKDCCCANFERALFRTRDAVKELSGWSCYKQQIEGLKDREILAPYDLRKDKPALLFLDAEGGLLHKQQLCVEPTKFLKVIQSTRKLSDLRLKFRDQHLAQRSQARKHIEAGKYDRAIRVLNSMIKNKKMMSGFVVQLVEDDLDMLSTTASGLLEEAAVLREDRRLLDSYRLYQEIEAEFARLEIFSKEASKHRKELFTALRRMGITPR